MNRLAGVWGLAMVFASAGLWAGPRFFFFGNVLESGGQTGSPSTANSHAGVTLVRDGIPGEYAAQIGKQNSVFPNELFAAGTNPAFFQTDAGSQWTTGIAANQTVMAVVQTYAGNNGWSGQAYAAAVTLQVASADIPMGLMNMPPAMLEPIPIPALLAADGTHISLKIGHFSDFSGRLEGYSLYRKLDAQSN